MGKINPMQFLLKWYINIIIILPACLKGQQGPSIGYDSLRYYQEQKDTVKYYRCLRRQIIIAADSLGDEALLDGLTAYLDPDPTTTNNAEKAKIRSICSVIGRRYMYTFQDRQKAETYFLHSHRCVADTVYLDNLAWNIENELMSLYNMQDDYEKSAYYSRLTEKSLQNQIDKEISSAKEQYSRFKVNEGLLKESLQDTAGAIGCYTNGLQLAHSIQLHTGIQANACGLGRMYLDLDSIALARYYLSLAEGTVDSIKKDKNAGKRLADIEMLGARIAYRSGQMSNDTVAMRSALHRYQTAIASLQALLNKPSREVAKYMVLYANALTNLDSLESAKKVLSEALDQISARSEDKPMLLPFEDLYHENTFIQIYEAYAEVCARAYKRYGEIAYIQEATDALDRAIYVNDIIINQVVDDPSKLLAIQTNKKMVHRELNLVYTLYQQQKDSVYLKKARDLFTRSKSLLLDEKIRQKQNALTLTAEERDWLRTWQLQLREAYQAKMVPGANSDSLSRVILDQKENIKSFWDTHPRNRIAHPIQGPYVDYTVYGDEVMVYYRIGDREGWKQLGSRHIMDSLIVKMNAYLASPLQVDDSVLCELYAFLIQPLSDTLPKAFTLLTDAEIGTIPFDALEDPEGQKLIEDHTLSYANQFMVYAIPEDTVPKAFDICLVAPTYEKDKATAYAPIRGGLYPLEYNRVEADSISILYGSSTLWPKLMRDDNVLDTLGLARIFHFAGHAIVDGDHAYLALSAADDPGQQISLEELSFAGHGPDLVVLSACETGLGKLALGEGIMSLGRSFAEAGAKEVVYSLWSVEDFATPKIMIAFYTYLKQGIPVPEALRKAKLGYISAAEEGEEHPYYWAGFVAASATNEK